MASKGSTIWYKSKNREIVEIKKLSKTGQYSKKDFNDIIGKVIHYEDFSNIVDNLNQILYDSHIIKQNNDKVQLNPKLYYISYISFALGLGYALCLYLTSTKKNNKLYILIATICLLLCTAIIFGISFYNFCRKIKAYKTIEEIVKENIEYYLGELNDLSENNKNDEIRRKVFFKYRPENGYVQILIFKPKDLLSSHYGFGLSENDKLKNDNEPLKENSSQRSNQKILNES